MKRKNVIQRVDVIINYGNEWYNETKTNEIKFGNLTSLRILHIRSSKYLL